MTPHIARVLTVLVLTSMATPAIASPQTRENARATMPGNTSAAARERASGNLPEYPNDAKQRGQGGVVTLEATIDGTGHVTTVHAVHGAAALEASAIAAVKTWQFKPLPAGTSGPTTQSLVFLLDPATGRVDEARRIPPQGPQPKRTKNVPPVYPASKASTGTRGQVTLDVVVNQAGKVIDLQVKKATSGFESAAREAAGQWEYQPLTENGKPVPFVATVTLIISKS